MSTIGRTIAAARENAGFTLADLSARTCIRRTVLDGIERDDFRACGGDFYARGHIRSVCRELGIDSGGLVEHYDREHAQERTVPAFTGRPVAGRADPDERDSGERGSGATARPEAASGAEGIPGARTEDSGAAPPAQRPADAHAAAGAAQQAAPAPAPAGAGGTGRERRGGSGDALPSEAAGGAGDGDAHSARHARRSGSERERSDEGAPTAAAAAAGTADGGDVPEPRRGRKPSLLAATIAAARRSWPLLVFVAIAGAAVVTALIAWPGDRDGQSAGAGRFVEREDAAGDGLLGEREEAAGDRRPGEGDGDGERGDAVPVPAQREERAEPAPTPATAGLGAGLSGVTTSERKAEQVHLTVSALDRVWVRIIDGDGHNRFSGVLEEGDVRAWTHPDELELHVGKASAVRITVNDEHIGRPDTAARVDRYTFSATDLA
ncbi:helix-turn-helix domain-containing protein [Streptomonospora salina]|uniref:helix-turn-helix domain-containing protein n=1 Tax=Streptomonospora salina TaxID=104205 RepID=UPI0031EE32E0